MATILITGGAGFIGSHLARWCLRYGHSVLIVDNCSTGNPENVPEETVFFHEDITSPGVYEDLKKYQIDAVFHLAAQSSGEISFENPVEDIRVNTLGTVQLLDFCKKSGIPRFIYASSMAVYGNQGHNPVHEDDIPAPLSFYGISKVSSEQYVSHYSRSGINTTIFRMFSVYGPGQNLSNMKQGMISIFLAYLLKNEPLVIKGSLERFRDFTYIDDVCKAWMTALDNEQTYGETYNLGTGIRTTVRELVAALFSAMDSDPGTYQIVVSGNTPDDQFGLYADIKRITRDLNWKPEYTLGGGLEEMIKWARTVKNKRGKMV